MNGAEKDIFAGIIADLAEVGRKLVETSESALARFARHEAECRPTSPRPEATDPMPITNPSLLLTQRQVAELLQIGPRTLQRWRNDPKVKLPRPICRGHVVRWRREEIEAWLGGRK